MKCEICTEKINYDKPYLVGNLPNSGAKIEEFYICSTCIDYGIVIKEWCVTKYNGLELEVLNEIK